MPILLKKRIVAQLPSFSFLFVIPAKAGPHLVTYPFDVPQEMTPRLRGGDEVLLVA